MFDRKLNSFRKLANKTLLRDFFNTQEKKNYKSISQIKNYFGFENANDTYEYLLDEYNKEVLKKQRSQAATRRQSKEKKLYTTNVSVFDVTKEKGDFGKFRKFLQRHTGENVMVQYIISSRVILNYEYDIPNNFSSWWKKISLNDWWIYENQVNEFKHHDFLGKVFLYKPNNKIKVEKFKQYFKEGISNCLLTPIRDWANCKLETAESKRTQERYNTILKRIGQFEKDYADGVPEEAVAMICNSLQVDIDIDLPLCENKFIRVQSLKKRLKQFRFMNTRLNHIDLNEVTTIDEVEKKTQQELHLIQKNLVDKGTYFTYQLNNSGLSKISTLTKQYGLKNDYAEVVNEFELLTGLSECKIDDIADFDLSQFIKQGTHYNGTIDFIDMESMDSMYDDYDSINHADMERAYANFKKCYLYEGFLGKVTDFRKTNKVVGVGLYKICDLDFTDCDGKFRLYNDKMKMYINNNVYPSPELKMLDSLGVKYSIVCGCWGVKSLDFEFSKAMIECKDSGIRYYAKWAGANDRHILTNSFWINTSPEHVSVIKEHTGEDAVVKSYDNGSCCIQYPKKHNFHLAHITAFLTSYQRISVLEQLMIMDYTKIIRVCVDGIYYTGESELKNVFRLKSDKCFGNGAGDYYLSNAYERELTVEGLDSRNHYAKELHLGEGGCGKTHNNCLDKGLVRPLFISPSWKLAVEKKSEYGMKCTVWARALTDDPERISAIRKYSNVLIIDEVSMLTDEQKNQFFKLYGDMKIIMCGDLGYQLPPVVGEECRLDGFDNIVRYSGSFRCKCPTLRSILDDLRVMISYDRSKSEINQYVTDYFKNLGRLISFEKVKEMYSIEDMILCGTNSLKKVFTSAFQGKFKTEKFYVKENNRLYSNGQIVIGDKPEHTNCEIQHAFTTHSIQGETAKHKLFIESSKMFDSRMFYTALSRASYVDQVFIVEPVEKVYRYEYAKIYKITSKSGVYIGSTISTIEKRFQEHKSGYEQYKKGKGKFITSYDLLGDEDAKIELVEVYKCDDLKELWEREAEVIQSCKCVNKTFNELGKSKQKAVYSKKWSDEEARWIFTCVGYEEK
jgi:hypothetical protein